MALLSRLQANTALTADPYLVWRHLNERLEAELKRAGVECNLLLRVAAEEDLVAAQHEGEPCLLLREAGACRRLKADAHRYARWCADHPAEWFPRARLLGLDHLHHCYVAVHLEKPRRGVEGACAIEAAAGWEQPRPLYLRGDAEAGRWAPWDVQFFQRKPSGSWFSDEEVARLARWEAVLPGYEREVEDWVIHTHLEPLLERLRGECDYHCHVLENGAKSNHYDVFVLKQPGTPFEPRPPLIDQGELSGLRVMFSLCAPVAALARGTIQFTFSGATASPVGVEDVLSAHEAAGRLERRVVGEIQSTPYRLLTREDVRRPLPAEARLLGYCAGPPPWERLFHALFQKRD